MIIKINQRSDEWHALRKNHIGASCSPILMLESPYQTPFGLWKQMLGLSPKTETNHAMQRGIDLEPIALQEFNELTGYDCVDTVMISDSTPYLMASLDGYDIDAQVGVEIKANGRKNHEIALSGQVPKEHYAQLMHQCYVANLEWIYYYSYDGNNNVLLKVPRCDKFINLLLEKLSEFWICLQNLESPKLCDKDYLTRNDEEWNHLTTEWKDINQHLKQLQKKEKELRDKLISICGQSNTMGNGIKLSKVNQRGRIAYEEIEELKDVDLEKYRKESIEFFRITERKE